MNYLFRLLLILFFFGTSCQGCEDTTEPILIIDLIYLDYFDYTYIRGVNSDEEIPIDYSVFKIPVAINSDTTTYLLYGGGIIDTLAISYERKFDFESKHCGFTITLDSFKLLNESSFDSVVFTIVESSYHTMFKSNQNEYYIEIYY